MDAMKHVGSRITLYRKLRNMTLEDLAREIHKSTSTLCKYERGNISADITTLFEIAKALEVNINQLVDYEPSDLPIKSKPKVTNFFGKNNRFYVYQYFPIWKRIQLGILDITRDPLSIEDDAAFYFDLSDTDLGSKSFRIKPGFVYIGKMQCDEHFMSLNLNNAAGMNDRIYIYAKSPLWTQKYSYGIMLSISQTFGSPSAAKMIFSSEPIKQDEELKHLLKLADEETLRYMKTTNMYIQF